MDKFWFKSDKNLRRESFRILKIIKIEIVFGNRLISELSGF